MAARDDNMAHASSPSVPICTEQSSNSTAPHRVILQRPSSAGSRPASVSSSLSSSSTRGPRPNQEICVGEELRIAVDIALEKFRLNPEQKELEFPSSFTATERAYVHRLTDDMGLKSKSRGKGSNRFLTVFKKEDKKAANSSARFQLTHNSRQQIHNLIQRFPLTSKERHELLPRTERITSSEGMRELGKTTTGRLNNGVSQVPPKRGTSDLNAFRETLPVYQMREQIVNAINSHQVVLISGETGSGKTTQVPQMILDDCHQRNKPCRMFCTQPRRISALSVAERVSTERGEKIGQTVGYQIRLESRVSPKTLLTFCTNGVLLRTLMGGEASMNAVTHIIVDETHERDRFSDFLLISLRDLLAKYKNLKVILMSAALNTQLFINYFGGCPIIEVPGKLFEVKEYFLEDVLKMTGYTNKKMIKYKSELEKVAEQQRHLDQWCNQQPSAERAEPEESVLEDSGVIEDRDDGIEVDKLGPEKEELEPWLVTEMDKLLTEAWLTGEEDIFTQIFHLIMSEDVTVDYMHSETSATPLMIAAARGFTSVVEQLLNLGANIKIKASNGWNALNWAEKFERTDVIEILKAYMTTSEEGEEGDDEDLLKDSEMTVSEEDKQLLNLYHHSFDDDKVDTDLILALLHKIQDSQEEGSILVFLPGYVEIVGLRDRIINDDKHFGDSNRYILFMLHSAMQTTDQKKVFKRPPAGVRKIILATNIAETSLTIDDVVFVIDSGKVKEKSFDALTSVSMLKCHWISKASALQRKGRAGRCRAGTCYHLFSRIRYNNMQEFQLPEILRFPLEELCLHTKLLTPVNIPIADFLAKAPEPPAYLTTMNAVQLLQKIDALDQWEDLTELGHHLSDLPVEPKYGKMVLFSVVLKCLDPILTVACALAYKDPFLLPSQPYQKRSLAMIRKTFASGTFSDHMTLLRAFQAWQKARADGWEKSFCERNYLSAATMEMIVGMRTQLLGQLRASGFVRARGGGDIRDLNANSENWAVVKAALCAGLYPNLIQVNRTKNQLMSQSEDNIKFHNLSVCSPAPTSATVFSSSHKQTVKSLPTNWLIYDEMTRAQRFASVRCCTVVSPITVSLFAGPSKLPPEVVKEAEGNLQELVQGNGYHEENSDSETEDKEDNKRCSLQLDDWVGFKLEPEVANLTLQLRQKWHSLLLRRMRSPSKPWSQVDESILRTLTHVITSEEQALGLQQPAGIGQRPRPMSAESSMHDGSRRGSEQSDDSDGRQRREDLGRRKRYDDRSAGSSRSNSAPGSASSSLKGSASNSPCPSPCNLPQQPNSPARTGQPVAPSTAGSGGSVVCCYFVIKCNNDKQLDASFNRGIWGPQIQTERKLVKAFREGKVVYLIFSVQGSGHFQGFAKMLAEPIKEKAPEFNYPGLGGTLSIQWIKRANLPFKNTHHLTNPWNENRRVQISRDGQEIEPSIGAQLIQLWDKLPDYKFKTSPQSRSKPFHSGDSARPGSQGNSPGRNYKSGDHHQQQQWTSPSGQHVQISGHYGHQGGSPGGSYHGQPFYNSSAAQQMAAQFNPLYINPMMSQGSGGGAAGSPGGVMIPNPQSPGQHFSPVMILQRGSAPPRGQGQAGHSGMQTPPPGSQQHLHQGVTPPHVSIPYSQGNNAPH